uniref:Maspardin n=1 Tax=Hucho hucho TaxID=62062 RepID=A0A4W5LK87_9TELE
MQYPVYWDLLEFCDGFRKLLDHLQLDKVHLFGASLGGFLAQKFAEHTHKSPRVHSLILCNSFSDTSIFNQTLTANRYSPGLYSFNEHCSKMKTIISYWTSPSSPALFICFVPFGA